MKIKLGILFLMIGFGLQAQISYSLEDAVQYGIKNNASIKLDELERRDAELDVKDYKAIGLPTIAGQIDYNYFIDLPVSLIPGDVFGGPPGSFQEVAFGTNNRLTGGLSVNQLIFDGSFFTGLKAQKLYLDLVSKNSDKTKFDIRSNITKAYMNVLLADENIKIIDKNTKNLDTSIKQTQALYENGFAEKLDLERLELSYDLLLSSRKNIERLRILNLNLLKYQMSYPNEQELLLAQSLDDIVDKIITVEPEKEDIDFSKRPEYRDILMGEQLNELELAANRNKRYPSVFGFASHEQLLQRNSLFDEDEPGFNKTTVAGFSVNIPIYTGGKTNVAIQKAKLKIENTSIQKSEFERSVELQIRNYFEVFINAKNDVFAAKRREALALDIYDVTVIKYQEGVGSSLERSQAERDVYTAQQAYMQALYDMVTAKIDLDIARGELEELKY